MQPPNSHALSTVQINQGQNSNYLQKQLQPIQGLKQSVSGSDELQQKFDTQLADIIKSLSIQNKEQTVAIEALTKENEELRTKFNAVTDTRGVKDLLQQVYVHKGQSDNYFTEIKAKQKIIKEQHDRLKLADEKQQQLEEQNFELEMKLKRLEQQMKIVQGNKQVQGVAIAADLQIFELQSQINDLAQINQKNLQQIQKLEAENARLSNLKQSGQISEQLKATQPENDKKEIQDLTRAVQDLINVVTELKQENQSLKSHQQNAELEAKLILDELGTDGLGEALRNKYHDNQFMNLDDLSRLDPLSAHSELLKSLTESQAENNRLLAELEKANKYSSTRKIIEKFSEEIDLNNIKVSDLTGDDPDKFLERFMIDSGQQLFPAAKAVRK